MRIESLLTEAEIAEEFAEALEARDLPEKFFYWSPQSVLAWTALSRDVAFESALHSWNLLVHDAGKLAGHFTTAVSMVSLGAGSGVKDLQLLKAMQLAGKEAMYIPVDASISLLETACVAAEDAEFDALGIKADISSPLHLVVISDFAENSRLFVLSANTLGGFDPLDLSEHLANILRDGDLLVVDAEIADGSALPSRNHPVGRRFALAPLTGLGVTADDGEVNFELKHDERHKGLDVVTRYFHADRDLLLNLPEKTIAVQRGERVSLNFNYIYSPEAFRWLLESHAGLNIVDEYPSPDGRYLTAVCRRA
jgi:uncharacterized SAM-dependent methyltransferase